MPPSIQLLVTNPCHEGWDNMTPVEKGRYCGSCSRTVIDFTDMSDAALIDYFTRPKEGPVCGRFANDQLGRKLETVSNKRRNRMGQLFASWALSALLFTSRVKAAESEPSPGTTNVLPADTVVPGEPIKVNLDWKIRLDSIEIQELRRTMMSQTFGFVQTLPPNIQLDRPSSVWLFLKDTLTRGLSVCRLVSFRPRTKDRERPADRLSLPGSLTLGPEFLRVEAKEEKPVTANDIISI